MDRQPVATQSRPRTAVPTWGQLMGRRFGRPHLVAAAATASAPSVRCEEPAAADPAEAVPPLDGAGVDDKQPEPPLQFEMFSREWSNMAGQDNFDGFRIEAATQVTKHLQASHTLFMGTQLREEGYIYQFGPVFQTDGQRTVMVARAGLDGTVNGRIIQKLGTGFEVKASSQSNLVDPQRTTHDAAMEYTGKNWTCGAKLAWQGAWLMGGSFTQRLVPQLQVGGDLTLVAVNNIMCIGQLGARWASGKDIVTASASRQPDPKSPVGASLNSLNLQYVRRVSERLALGTEYKYSHPDQDSGLSMAYEYTFRNARIQGMLDSAGRVSCCVSDYQGMGISGVIDYIKGDYKFGVLMHVMPPEQGQAPA